MSETRLDNGGRHRGDGEPDIDTRRGENADFDLAGIVKALRRQWLILLMMLVATGAAAVGATVKLPPTYQAVGTIVLVPPGGGANGGNPYDHFTSADHILAKVVLTSVMSQAVQDQIASRGGVPYTVITDLESPTMTITATGSDPLRTESTMRAVIDSISGFLSDHQQSSGTAPSSWFTVAPISVPAAAQKTAAGVRNGVIVGVLGLIASLSVSLIVDQSAMRRRRSLAGTRRPSGLAWGEPDAASANAAEAKSVRLRSRQAPSGGVMAGPRSS